jgi:hypothetical protein
LRTLLNVLILDLPHGVTSVPEGADDGQPSPVAGLRVALSGILDRLSAGRCTLRRRRGRSSLGSGASLGSGGFGGGGSRISGGGGFGGCRVRCDGNGDGRRATRRDCGRGVEDRRLVRDDTRVGYGGLVSLLLLLFLLLLLLFLLFLLLLLLLLFLLLLFLLLLLLLVGLAFASVLSLVLALALGGLTGGLSLGPAAEAEAGEKLVKLTRPSGSSRTSTSGSEQR